MTRVSVGASRALVYRVSELLKLLEGLDAELPK